MNSQLLEIVDWPTLTNARSKKRTFRGSAGPLRRVCHRRDRLQSGQEASCLSNATLALLGDKWSIIVIRDIMFTNRRHFEGLLSKSYEGIPSKILANRLKKLVDLGMVVRAQDSTRKQKGIISLTEQSIQLVPIMVQIGFWGLEHCPASGGFRGRFKTIANGGPKRRHVFMQELRRRHLKDSA